MGCEREGGNETKRPDVAEDLSDGVPEGSPDRAEASISRRGRGVSLPVLPSLSSAALPFEPAASPVPAEDPLPSFLKSLHSGPSFPFLSSSSLSMRSFPSSVSPDVQGEDLRRARPPSLIRPRCTDDDLFEPTSIVTSVHLRHTKHTFGRARTRSDRRRNDMATVTRMSARQGTSRGNQTARLAKRCVPKDPTHETGGRKERGTEWADGRHASTANTTNATVHGRMDLRRTNQRAASVVCSANGIAQALEKAGKAATVSLGAGALLASVRVLDPRHERTKRAVSQDTHECVDPVLTRGNDAGLPSNHLR